MTTFIALLRAVNVGGTGKLPMKDLAALCADLGFGNVRTYIQSGNVIFQSAAAEPKIRTALEQALTKKMGKPIDVMVRTADQMSSILEANPFRDEAPAKVAIAFLSAPIAEAALQHIATPTGEQVRSGHREIYIYFANGMGRSKFKLPRDLGPSTARNINTVAKLVEIAAAL